MTLASKLKSTEIGGPCWPRAQGPSQKRGKCQDRTGLACSCSHSNCCCLCKNELVEVPTEMGDPSPTPHWGAVGKESSSLLWVCSLVDSPRSSGWPHTPGILITIHYPSVPQSAPNDHSGHSLEELLVRFKLSLFCSVSKQRLWRIKNSLPVFQTKKDLHTPSSFLLLAVCFFMFSRLPSLWLLPISASWPKVLFN